MKKILVLLLLFCGITLHAANPSYNNFNSNQFQTTGYTISIKNGAITTNLNGNSITNIRGSNVDTVYSTGLTATTNGSGQVSVTGASSLTSYNANQFTTTAGGTLLNIKETASVSNLVVKQGTFTATDVSLTVSNRPGSVVNLIEVYTNAASLVAYLNSNGVWFCSTLLLAPGDMGIRRLNSSVMRLNNGIADFLNSLQVDSLYASTSIENNGSYYISTNANRQLVISSLNDHWARNLAITNRLNAGTNIVTDGYGTNYHTIALPGNAVAMSFVGDTGTGSNYVNVPMFGNSGWTNSANIQSSQLNVKVTSGNAVENFTTVNSRYTFTAVDNSQFRIGSSSSEIAQFAPNGGLHIGTSTATAAADGLFVDRGISVGGNTDSGIGNIKASGIITATNGFQSIARNLATPLAITVGSSPLLLTNSSATALGGTNNVFVFIDGAGVTGTVGINGTTIYSALAGADATVPLQPGEYCTITWTVGTPVVKAKPF